MTKFKVGDRVKCTHPEIVWEAYKNVVGVIQYVSKYGPGQSFDIRFPDGEVLAAFAEKDGVVLVEEGVSMEEFGNEFYVGDVVVSIDDTLDINLAGDGAPTGVMKVLDVQADTLLVKYFNESGTYNYGTVKGSGVVQAV